MDIDILLPGLPASGWLPACPWIRRACSRLSRTCSRLWSPCLPPSGTTVTHSTLILSSRATPSREAILRLSSKAILLYVLSMPLLSLIAAGWRPALSVAAARAWYAAPSPSLGCPHQRDQGRCLAKFGSTKIAISVVRSGRSRWYPSLHCLAQL